MRVCKCTAAAVLATLALTGLGAQSQAALPSLSMPKISAPAMPSVSAPSVGGGFYVPGSSGFYTGAAPSGVTGTGTGSANGNGAGAGSSDSAGTVRTTGEGSANSSGSSASSVLQNVADNSRLRSSLSSASSELSTLLSAGDLNSLVSAGSLGNLSSLLGSNASMLSSGSVSATSNGGRYLSSTQVSDQKVLQQILSELSELKKEVGAQNNAASSAYGRNLSKGPRILRFLAGGTDILSTCREVFFSSQESDGTFLLTGDRTYTVSGEAAARTETFYLLFKATGCTAGKTSYTVTPHLSQTVSDSSSPLAFLSDSASSFTASRTGNLVILRGNSKGSPIDILLSLDN